MTEILDALLVCVFEMAHGASVWLCGHCDGGHSYTELGWYHDRKGDKHISVAPQCEFCGHWRREGEGSDPSH